MVETPIILGDTHNPGPRSREWLISYGNEQVLAARQIEAVGWVEARDGYAVAEASPVVTMLYACLSGWGEVFVNGRWQRCTPGTAYLAPRHRFKAYRSAAGVEWQSCWVLGRDESLIDVTEPALISASPQALFAAIQGLYYEDTGRAEPAQVEQWVDLIVVYTRRIGLRGGRPEGRLHTVWERVSADLAHPWTVRSLGALVDLSEESMRRVCLRETGRTPMEHVTQLRMRAAASLLVTHPYSVSLVAPQVGYNNAFAFSSAFKRVFGVTPTEYRRGRRGA